MSHLPTLTAEQVDAVIESVSDVVEIGRGGQKIVFRCAIEGEPFAIKFILCPDTLGWDDSEDEESEYEPEVIIRAKREIETMRYCTSEHMVKLGPIGLEFLDIDGENLAYYTEELIDGHDLKSVLDDNSTLAPEELIELGLDVTDAIKALWDIGKIHRDIKPGNIMRRSAGGYVLLDAGLAIDVAGESLSGGFTVGTRLYFSPEQFDYSSRRSSLDFRSDIFALGVTMYHLATGNHPFYSRGISSETFFNNVTSEAPKPITESVSGFPERLNEVILRMLGKSPHLRFRKCELVTRELMAVKAEL